MLTPGNSKLGSDLIWGFGLPSGGPICVGLSKTCRKVCYAVRTEQYRQQAAERYRHNFLLTKKKSFVQRMRAFLIAHHIRVVRIHTGGEFYSRRYIRKWRRIIRRSPKVRFFTYTRGWRIPGLQVELSQLAKLPNCQLWYSADRETGMPKSVPPFVRIAWLMTEETDEPPQSNVKADLIFRVNRLRKTPLENLAGIPVCPAEAAGPGPKITCDHCGICWRTSSKLVPHSMIPSNRTKCGRKPLPLISNPYRNGLACSQLK